MFKRSRLTLLLLLGACSRGEQAQSGAPADSTIRLVPSDTQAVLNDTPLPDSVTPNAGAAPAAKPTTSASKPAATMPAKPPAAAPAAPARPATLTLDAGTTFAAASSDSMSSRTDKAGKQFSVTVQEDVKDAKGNVVIPSGSVVHFEVTAIAPAENKDQVDGVLTARVLGATVRGDEVALSATVDRIEHTVKGRGVTGGDVAKVGAGAAAGAVLGRIIGGKKSGTIVGGVVGAAAGTAAAAHSADRDVVVAKGAKVTLTLRDPFTVRNP